MSATNEILILGGGPAGASAARLLASWGHRVRLITRPPGEHRLAVSLPPSCAKLFDVIGVAEAIERAGFIRSTGNTVWWGSAEARVEPFADGARGWQVVLADLERLLLREASRAGVTIERRRLTADDVRRGGPLVPPDGLVLDCTGRGGRVARAEGLRRYDDGPKTIALAGEWRCEAWPLPDDSHTLVESYADGWMWSVPTAPRLRHVCAMIDPQRSALARDGSARESYLAEIAKTQVFSRLLSEASLAMGPSGWDASTYDAREYAGEGWLLVGDAGSFVDPLSSVGVKKALASAWLAAVTAHTCLTAPSMQPHALRFFDAREREIERHHRAESVAFLAGAARQHDRPFWAERLEEQAASDDGPAVRAAHAQLKQAPFIKLARSAAVRVAPAPMVAGREIVLAPHLIVVGGPPVRYVHGIDLILLTELAPAASQVPDLFEAYTRRSAPPPLHDFLLALSTAVARGWLVSQ